MDEGSQAIETGCEGRGRASEEELLSETKNTEDTRVNEGESKNERPNNIDEEADGSTKNISESEESKAEHRNDQSVKVGTTCTESKFGTEGSAREGSPTGASDWNNITDRDGHQPHEKSDNDSSGNTSSEKSSSAKALGDEEGPVLAQPKAETSQLIDGLPEKEVQSKAEPTSPVKEDDRQAEGLAREATDQTNEKVEANDQVLNTSPEDEFDDVTHIKANSSDKPKDFLDEVSENKEKGELSPTSNNSFNQSAKAISPTKVTLQEQQKEIETSVLRTGASKQSLPSSETMQSDNKHPSVVEDKVNNNVQKCSISYQESESEIGLSDSSPEVSSDHCEVINRVVEPDKEKTTSCQALGKASKVLDSSDNQDRSMLMQYLGLQPVQDSKKSNGKVPKDGGNVASIKPRFAFTFVDSFGPMPGLDFINPYDKAHISQNTSPFEVYSEGSHSPEPPILAETPVVGSSPPHHDFDAIEARMIDMAPRSNSQNSKRDLLSSFPSSDAARHDAKVTFQRKQTAVSHYLPSHSLENLCHRLAERVEPDATRQDETEQGETDLTRAESKKFSSSSDVVPCPRCHRTFKNRNQLRGHLRWHINDPINLLSGRWPEERASPNLQVSNSEGKSHSQKSKSKSHLKVGGQRAITQNSSGETPESFYCKFCPKVFRTSLKLRGHMMVHKRKQSRRKGPYWRNKPSKGTGSTGRVIMYQCEVCSKVFGSQMKLNAHMTSHANEVHPRSKGVKRIGSFTSNVIIKNQDGSSPSSASNVSSIKQNIALGKRKGPLKCDICFKTFLTLRALNGHKGIHSAKWKLANDLHHLGRPVKIKSPKEGSIPSVHARNKSPCAEIPKETCLQETKRGEGELANGVDHPKAEKPANSLNYGMPRIFFKCSKCQLVFVSRHRVRKHLFKIHSISPPGSESFTEEKVEGCKFCEVFKERKRGRPKRGENTLIKCPHGKNVVGYNLPVNVIRHNRRNRRNTGRIKRLKTSENTDVSLTDVMQQECTVKLSPVDVKVSEENRSENVGPDSKKISSESSEQVPTQKKRGRPPKNYSNPLFTVKSVRKNIYSVGAVKSHRSGTRHAVSSIRRRARTGKDITLLGRQMKSGWDPKRQRFIGRPYKCHLCKMSYRSERQLCSHMRSHGIHVFDLSQLPSDQRKNPLIANGELETKVSEKSDMTLDEAIQNTDCGDTITNHTLVDTETQSERKGSESGVGGICAVCSKEFDSDNMFHQHLLGRFNKKCRQEWMKQTYGFGMRSKVESSPQHDEVSVSTSVDPAGEQNSGNIYVIDKISMESIQGAGVFTSLQQKVNPKLEDTIQGEKSSKSCTESDNQDERKDVEQVPSLNTANVDSGPTSIVSSKKGSVLDAVINRLTQSSKISSVTESLTPPTAQSSIPRAKKRKLSNKELLFKCHSCMKAFDKKQKLSVHALIHRAKVATVMDHVENASQRSASSINVLSQGDEQQEPVKEQGASTDTVVKVPETLPPLQLTYSCSECPKHFTSNLKLACHLKMHMKSTKSRGNTPESNCTDKLQEAKQEPNPSSAEMEAVPSSEVLDVQVDGERVEKAEDLSGISEKVMLVEDSSKHVEPACQPTEVHEANIFNDKSLQETSNKPLANSEVKEAPETSPTESDTNSTSSRPRLLLKINPAKLQRFYDCPECQKSFKSRRQLSNHQLLHMSQDHSTKEHNAVSLDGADFLMTSSEVSEHSQVNHSEITSETCDSVERNTSGDAHHKDLLQSGSENFYADTESESFALQNTAYEKQSDEVHPSEIPHQEITVPCKICDKVMKKSQLGGHMKSHTKGLLSRRFSAALQDGINSTQQASPYAAKVMPLTSVHPESSVSPHPGFGNTHDQFSLHIENGMSRVTSEKENATLRRNELNGVAAESQPNYPKGRKFTCDICNTHYDLYQELCQHLKVHVFKNPSFNDGSEKEEMSNGTALSDGSIEKQAPNTERFNQSFIRPKVYPCELCGFSFSSFRQFRVHISQTHGGKYQYRLMIQQKEAAKAGAFLKEPDTINKTHPHKCDVCGRRFKRLALLIFHLNKLHKGWKQRLCMMNVRSRPRPQQTTFQNLQGTNSSSGTSTTDSGDLPFTCELCGKSFRMKVQLCGHMKTHGRVGHSPIKISPLAMKGKYTLRKSRKPDFRLSDDWILDMDDEQVAFDHSLALQQMPPRPSLMEQQKNVKVTSDPAHYSSLYTPKPLSSSSLPSKEMLSGLPSPDDQYRMQMSSPEMPGIPQAMDLKTAAAPAPPDPSKFITIQMEPVLQQLLHRCLLCHSYFSSQESAILHCKEVHLKKKPKHLPSNGASQGLAHPLGHNLPSTEVRSGIRAPSQISPGIRQTRPQVPLGIRPTRPQISPGIRPTRPQVLPNIRPPTSHLLPHPQPPLSRLSPGMRSPTGQMAPSIRPPQVKRVTSPPSRIEVSHEQSVSLPFTGAMPKSKVNGIPTSTPSAKTISQTPFNEMLYRVEMSEGQTRYVCNTCKSTFLHYNFLMSHLADHNHLAYTCLQCGYATYSEKDYQLHCQLHDGQISKKIRRVRPKPPGFASQSDEKIGAPRAVATCHICQRSFVNMKGLKAHMVLHSANFNSISERRNESKRVPRKPVVGAQPCFNDASQEPLALIKPAEEQTEALDLSVKPVEESLDDEVLDLSMKTTTSLQAESPVQEMPLNMAMESIPEESQAVSLPDVCQVLQKVDVPKEPPSPQPPVDKQPFVRKPKNSIRLVGAIDVDVASLENKYSVVTDLMDTDSDISPDPPPPPHGQESTSGSGEGEGENDGKSPKKFRNFKCSMCQYATDFKESMDRHEQKHRKFRTLACHQCSYRTPEKRLMLRHVLTIHEKQKPYECKLCNYSSAYKHHLKRHHTKRHQRPLLTCAQCEFTTEDVTKMEEHNATHPEPKVYKCKLCPMVFNSSKLFKAHKQIVHNKKKKSKKSNRDRSHSSSGTGETSESVEDKKKEVIVPPESLEPVVLKHQCKLCKYQTDDQSEFTKHLMNKHFSSQTKEGLGDVCTTAQCPQCGYLTGKDQLKAHMMIHDGEEVFDCDQCLFKACTQEELDTHVKEKHKVKLATTLVCKMCNMHFWDAEDMKQHTEMHLKDSSISIKNPFLCNMCPLKLMNRRDALRHIQLHTDRYPFKCRHCVFSCFTKASIQRHLAIHRHAAKPKPLMAVRKNSRKTLSTGCNSSSERNPAVDNSRRKNQSSKSSNFGPVANRLPIYKCQFCSHEFRVAEEWQRHERRHHMTWPE